jgi:hypothetical protein
VPGASVNVCVKVCPLLWIPESIVSPAEVDVTLCMWLPFHVHVSVAPEATVIACGE